MYHFPQNGIYEDQVFWQGHCKRRCKACSEWLKSSFQHSIRTSAERICCNGSKQKAAGGGLPACLAERCLGSEHLRGGVIWNFPNPLHEHVVCPASGSCLWLSGGFSQCVLALQPTQNGLGHGNPSFRGQMVYIIKSTVSLTGSLSGDPKDDQGQRVIIIGCCSSCARAASAVLNVSYSNVQGRRFAKQSSGELLNPTGFPRTRRVSGPFQLQKGLEPLFRICSYFSWMPMMNLQFFMGRKTRIQSSMAKQTSS